MRVKIEIKPVDRERWNFTAEVEQVFNFWQKYILFKFPEYGYGVGQTADEAVVNAKKDLLNKLSSEGNKKVWEENL